MSETFVPLSVREGNWRTKLGWRAKNARTRFAVWVAPWLSGRAYKSSVHINPQLLREVEDSLTQGLVDRRTLEEDLQEALGLPTDCEKKISTRTMLHVKVWGLALLARHGRHKA